MSSAQINLKLIPFKRIFERVELSKDESETEYFMSLLYAGEQLTKLVTLSLVAGVQDGTNRAKYNQLFNLVRADGIGAWSKCIDEVVLGPTSHSCIVEMKRICKDLVQKTPKHNWQYDSVSLLHLCLKMLGENIEDIPTKVQAKIWFQYFAQLRNKTRGHGAPRMDIINSICPLLEKSIKLVICNFSLFDLEWVFLFQNLSGKYRVSNISDNTNNFSYLKSSDGKREHHVNGVYIYLNRPLMVNLVFTDAELRDFYFPNGGFSQRRFETLSYITGNKDSKDNKDFLVPSGHLPSSETEGAKSLEVIGNCFTNLPKYESLYIHRNLLETQLYNVIVDDRHPVITLVGRGGIGKTSLALNMLKALCNAQKFQTILWFSARDIDLLEEGVKSVKAGVISKEDIVTEFVELIQPSGYEDKSFDRRTYLEGQLSKCDLGPLLLVLDNFETVQNPEEMFTWLDTYIRLPNKILITSRFRDFKADYPISVGGLNRDEFDKLVHKATNDLAIGDLITPEYHTELFYETGGHPYVTKILLGEVSKKRKLGDIKRMVSSDEDLLTALFDRTYAIMSVAAKRVFLTLCGWRSTIPQLGIEAVLRARVEEKFDVEEAIEELYSFSFIDKIKSNADGLSFLFVPLSAFLFGKKKLSVNPEKSLIDSDIKLLMLFGVGKVDQVHDGVRAKIDNFFRQVANGLQNQSIRLEQVDSILRQICARHNESWLSLATLYQENGLFDKRVECYQQYLESELDHNKKISVWKTLAGLYNANEQYFEEANAIVQMCAIQTTSLSLISSSIGRINQIVSSDRIGNQDQKIAIVNSMIEIWKGRFDPGLNIDNNDNSKLAWLYINSGNIKEAKKIVKKILDNEPKHYHALKLSRTLHMDDE